MNTIKTKRENANMTQIELANQLGVTQGAVSQWESGITKPTIDLMFRIAKIFDCTAEELFCIEKTPSRADWA